MTKQPLNALGCALALIFSLLLPSPLLAQIPPGGSNIVINSTPISNGTNGLCLYDNNGKVGEQACGGGGTPGGLNTQLQYNNNGAFAGISGATTDGSIVSLNAPIFNAPVLGTPASGVATNLTGTAAGLTAGTVTTNANLTGPITSVGNATSIAAQTGTGTTFVVQANPSITAPTLTGTTSIGGTANISSPSAGVFIHGTSANGTPVIQTIGCENAAGTNIAAASSCINWGPLSTGTGAAGTYNISTGFAGLTGGATATFTNASPTVVTVTASGYVPGQPVQYSNSGGALPTGISAATNYFICNDASYTANNAHISLTYANGVCGTLVNTTSTGTGTQTSTPQTTVQNPASTVATFGPSGLTGSQTTSGLLIQQVWNTSGGPTALKVNVTNIASSSGLLADFQVGGSTVARITTAGTLISSGSINLTAGNVNIGAAQAFDWTTRSAILSPADGVIELLNNANTDFGRLQFGGTTSSFPALKRSTTTLAVRLADDSADAPITASNGTFSGQLNVTAMTQTAVAQSGTVCYNSGTGAVTYDSTVGCLTSTMTEKDNWQDITPQQALAVVLKMQAGSYTYKKGRGLPEGPQVGLSAEQIETLDDRLVGHRPNGDLAGVRYQQASALYPMAIQQLKADNDNLRAELRDLRRIVGR